MKTEVHDNLVDSSNRNRIVNSSFPQRQPLDVAKPSLFTGA